MFSSTRKIQWWKLEEHKTLESIIPLLSLDYSTNNIENSTISLEHRWMPVNGETFQTSIERFEINGIQGRYFPARARIDVLQIQEEFLQHASREIAINEHIFPVLFVEINGIVNVIVSASASCFSKIRTQLMKHRATQIQWGKIIFNNIPLEKSFFYWLMSQKSKKVRLYKEEFTLVDFVGFKSHTDREQHKYNGTGQSIDDEVPVQAMICLYNNFSGLDVILRNDAAIVAFSFADNLETKVDFLQCKKFITPDKFESFNEYELLLKIFLQIIPGMVIKFNEFKEKATWRQSEKKFRQTVALQAIKEIMAENDIVLSDLEQTS